jgi:hypothetical protein
VARHSNACTRNLRFRKKMGCGGKAEDHGVEQENRSSLMTINVLSGIGIVANDKHFLV